jgi:hypothetical protein
MNDGNITVTNTSTITGTFYWGGKPVIDDDEGSAGVREPRRPRNGPPSLGMEKALADDEGLILI